MGLLRETMKLLARGVQAYTRMKVPEQHDIDLNVYYPKEFREALKFASQYKDIDGVNEIISDFANECEKYRKEAETLANAKRDNLNVAYEKMNTAYKQRNLCKWFPIIFWAMLIILPNSFSGFATVGLVATLILTVVLFVRAKILYSQHQSCFLDIKENAATLYDKYSSHIENVKEQSDAMYLNSLDPTHRETVLMRREQQRFMEEQRRSQETHQHRVEETQRRQAQAQQLHQQREAEKQDKTRDYQQEMLRMERDKEDRYYRNRK